MHIPITFPFSPMSDYSPIPIQNWVMGAHGGHVICVTRRDTTEHARFRGGSRIRGKSGEGGVAHHIDRPQLFFLFFSFCAASGRRCGLTHHTGGWGVGLG